MHSSIGQKRTRSGYAVSYKRPAAKQRVMRAVSRIPRAPALRAVPVGHAIIPVSIFRKVYWNMSTGLWETSQSTGASIGVSGYNGFSFHSSLDVSSMSLGNGAFSAANAQTVPGFSELQTVFDQCRINRIDYEFWFANVSGAPNTTAFDSPELFMVKDYDNADPPSALNDLLQYQKVERVVGNANYPKYRITIYPKVRTAVGSSSDEAGTTTTLAGVASAGFQDAQKPGAQHFGLRGWFNTNSIQSATLGYLHVMEKQYREYKISK